MRRIVVMLVASFSALAATEASGEPVTYVSSLEEEVEVLARRLPRDLASTGASVTVIGPERLAERRDDFAAAAAAAAPGTYVAGGAPGTATSLFLRGAGSNQSVVLLDGVRVNDPTIGGQFNFFDLGLGNIERVEVLRGAASSLYGSDAAGGVVNFVTRTGRGAPRFAASAEGGSYGHYATSVSSTGAAGDFDWSFDGGRTRWGNDLPHSEFASNAVAGNAGYSPAEGTRVRVRGRFTDSRTEEPWDFPSGPQIPEDDNLDRTREQWLLAAGVAQDLPGGFVAAVDLSVFRTSSLLDNGPDAPGLPQELRSRSIAEVETATLTVRREAIEVAEWCALDLLGGGEAEDEDSENRVNSSFGPSPPVDRTVRNRAAFLLAEATLFADLVVSAGVRRDHSSFFGGETTGSGSVLWRLAGGTRLRANAGQAFRGPTPVEFDDPWVGNADLEPEESTAFDVGVEQEMLDGALLAGVTLFRLRTKDLIAYDGTSMRLENVKRARVRGIETEVVARPREDLSARVFVTLQDPEDLSAAPGEEDRLAGRPRWYGGAEVAWRRDPVTIALVADLSGDHPDHGTRDPGGHRRDRPGERVLLALRGSGEVADGVTLLARIENLLDDEWYPTEYSPAGLGIGVYVGVRVEF